MMWNRMRGLWRRMAAGLVAAGIVMGNLSGCGSGKEQEMGGGDGQNVSGGNRMEETGGDGEIAAVGRYVEVEMGLPQDVVEDRFVALFYGRDGNLELYMAREEGPEDVSGVRRFLREGEDWRLDEGWWDRVKPQGELVDIRRVFFGLDGNYYFTVMTREDYVCHLYQVQQEGESRELIPEVFQAEEGKEYGLIPTKVEVGKNGNILVHTFDDCVYYQPDGKKLFSMDKAWSGTSESSAGYLTEEEFITGAESGVARYSLDGGKLVETIPYEGVKRESDEGTVLFGDRSGGICMAGEQGLSRVNPGGSLWEQIIDGSLNTMGMKSVYLEEFLAGEDEDYFAAFVGEGGKGLMLCRYMYDPDMSAVPPVTLTVYGLKDNSTVRQTAVLFQKDYPDVRVEVLNGADQDGNVSEDTIRALNTEILGGRGADVLILDGLPGKAYQEKGILMDLRDVFETVQRENPMMEQVLADFTEDDGSIYQMPARISVPLIMGEDPALKAIESLEGMKRYEGEVPLIYTSTYANMLRMVASIRYEEIFGSGTLTEEMLISYLETVKALTDQNHAKSMFTEEEMEKMYISNHEVPYGIYGSDSRFDQGLSGCGMMHLEGMFSVILFEAVLDKHPEARQDTINGIYFPEVLAGVNQNTDQPDLAKEFVRRMFTTEVQKEELFDGFAVNLEAQQINCETDKEGVSVGSGYGDYYIGGSWPDLERRKEIYKIIRTVSVPVVVDETVMRMIVDGAEEYLDGKISAEQAAGGIYRQVRLYEAERE